MKCPKRKYTKILTKKLLKHLYWDKKLTLRKIANIINKEKGLSISGYTIWIYLKYYNIPIRHRGRYKGRHISKIHKKHISEGKRHKNNKRINLVALAARLVNTYLSICGEPEIIQYLIAPQLKIEVLKELLHFYNHMNLDKKGNCKPRVNLKKTVKKLKDKIKPVLKNLANAHKYYDYLSKRAIKDGLAQPIINYFIEFKNSDLREIKEYLGV